MSLNKYKVTVTAHVGGDSKTRTMEVHAANEDDARSLVRSFTGPLWEVDKIEKTGESNAPSGRK